MKYYVGWRILKDKMSFLALGISISLKNFLNYKKNKIMKIMNQVNLTGQISLISDAIIKNMFHKVFYTIKNGCRYI